MLPVIPAAEDRERHYAKKARKRKQKDIVMSGSRDLAANRRRSTIKTETTLAESNDGDAKKESERSSYHQRDLSVTVNWTKDNIERMARELDEGVISDLDLSLFAFWIKAKHENYLFARDFVRELALDQVGGAFTLSSALQLILSGLQCRSGLKHACAQVAAGSTRCSTKVRTWRTVFSQIGCNRRVPP